MPHYPRTAGSPTGAQAVGDLARGEGLLGPAPAAVGEPAPGAAPRARPILGGAARPPEPGEPPRRAGRALAAAVPRGPRRCRAPRRASSTNVAEDRQPLVVGRAPSSSLVLVVAVGTPARSRTRLGGVDPAPRSGRPGRARPTGASRSRGPAVRPSSTSRAWNVSSARSAMTTSRIGRRRAPRARRRTGRGSAAAPA